MTLWQFSGLSAEYCTRTTTNWLYSIARLIWYVMYKQNNNNKNTKRCEYWYTRASTHFDPIAVNACVYSQKNGELNKRRHWCLAAAHTSRWTRSSSPQPPPRSVMMNCMFLWCARAPNASACIRTRRRFLVNLLIRTVRERRLDRIILHWLRRLAVCVLCVFVFWRIRFYVGDDGRAVPVKICVIWRI